MFKRNLSLMLIGSLIFSLAVAPSVLAHPKKEKEAAFAAKVKAGIAKLGAGQDARISVKLRNKTKLNGYVSHIGEDAFVIADAKTGVTTEVAYPDVAQVKGNNLSTGATIAIAVGIAVGVVFLIGFILSRTLD